MLNDNCKQSINASTRLALTALPLSGSIHHRGAQSRPQDPVIMQEQVDCGAHWAGDWEGAMKRKSRIARMSVLLTVLACIVIVATINEF
jgi:hypothetical protein